MKLFFFKYKSQNWTFVLYDSKIWTFLWYDSKNWAIFMTQRIGLFSVWLTDFLLNTTHRNEPFFFEYDERIELFLFWYESKKLTSFSDMTQ